MKNVNDELADALRKKIAQLRFLIKEKSEEIHMISITLARYESMLKETEHAIGGVLALSSERVEHKGLVTIKDYILNVLGEVYPNSISAAEILKLVNDRWDKPLDRTSLSPQLSRLVAAGRVVKEGKSYSLLRPDSE